MKVIIIGASLSGKTYAIKQLRSITKVEISEMDEELTRLNDGEYPLDSEHKHNVLAPRVIKDVFNRDNIIFFTNTDYFTFKDLRKAKSHGFKIVQIKVGLDELLRRNEGRVKNEGYEDIGKWLKGMVKYQSTVRKTGLIDEVIQGGKSIDKVVREIMDTLVIK